MERIVRFSKPFDKRNPEPSKNYGIGCSQCYMILKGDKGAVDFTFSTGIYPHHLYEEWKKSGTTAREPMGFQVGYHSPVAQHKGQEPLTQDCETIGGVCYSDGGFCIADDYYKLLIEEGDEAVWAKLQEYYSLVFEAQ